MVGRGGIEPPNRRHQDFQTAPWISRCRRLPMPRTGCAACWGRTPACGS